MGNNQKEIPQRSQVDSLPMWRAYKDRETGTEGMLLTDLAIKRGRVTLDSNYTGSDEDILNGKTIFKEITITQPEIPQSIQNFIKEGNSQGTNDIPSIANAISDVLARRWDPKQFHLVLHKCGYDSRILSKTLANLRDKYGKEWLGDVIFLCFEPESAAFKETMEMEGWQKGQYLVCNEGAEPGEYYSGVLDFDNCWLSANDAQPPIWISMHTIQQLRLSGIICKPLSQTQIFHWGGGNHVFKLPPEEVMNIYFYSRWGAGGYVHPFSEQFMFFVSLDVLRLINPHPDLEIRDKILEYISPELYKLPKGVEDNASAPHRQLSERLRNQCQKSFMGSWYYNKVLSPGSSVGELAIPKILWRDDWWGIYAKASLCEYLVRNNVEIML